jgi:urea carboxylase/allophanate hydrolase
MNTRLQVEHPVTDAVTGLDLVKCMLHIAIGDCATLFPLEINNISTKALPLKCASTPKVLQSFRPSPGKLLNVEFPCDVRVDTWVASGQDLSTSFDPMVAKIISYGKDRATAIRKLSLALEKTIVTGVETNLGYLRLGLGRFHCWRIHDKYIEQVSIPSPGGRGH